MKNIRKSQSNTFNLEIESEGLQNLCSRKITYRLGTFEKWQPTKLKTECSGIGVLFPAIAISYCGNFTNFFSPKLSFSRTSLQVLGGRPVSLLIARPHAKHAERVIRPFASQKVEPFEIEKRQSVVDKRICVHGNICFA